jgi:MSHA biogenesis protein MshL
MKPDLDALLDDPPAIALLAPWTLALLGVVLLLLLVGCASPRKSEPLLPEVRAALSEPAQAKPAPLPAAVANALLPPADLSLPSLNGKTAEPRFDLNVVGLPAGQVFAALAKDTRYSMLVDPSLITPVTVNLKDVTLVEALETLREMYGFEYRVQGTRVFVQPATLATRVFQVSYLTSNRTGRSDVRVTSGSISNTGANASGSAASNPPVSTAVSQESSRITTQTRSDLWVELEASLRLLVGADAKNDRQVIVSPQSGVIVVRGLPRELRAVEQYLRAARLNIERQVMLEAKIIDVQLRDGSQTGINWAAFISGNNHAGSVGPITPGTTLATTGTISSGDLSAIPGSTLALASSAANGLFGLAFQTSNFAALLQFLETQGNVQVLSSPRIAALNNQKAVLKVGTDDFFVTGITTTTTASTTGNVTSPTITVQPFFSGVALDVTPQIDENASIILHVHPSVSSVTERNKVLNLGDLGGTIVLPLASSTVSETDTIVRVRDGAIVAIGGLMKVARVYDRNQLPGVGDIPVAGNLFGSTTRANGKSELVILIKPTVINSDAQLDAVHDGTLDRLDALAARP